MLHEFKRKYQLYSSVLPAKDDNLEWLAIMQHHGAPTRLLDFTDSFLIATYFSVVESVTDSSLWFVDSFTLKHALRQRFNLTYDPSKVLKDEVDKLHIDLANLFIGNISVNFKGNSPKGIIPLEPKNCTERLAKQQGLFLMPTLSKVSFFENLKATFNVEEIEFENVSFDELTDHVNSPERFNKASNLKIIKMDIPKKLHENILYSLKQMNITAEILFPGIDGLAKSLQQSHIRLL